MCERASSDQCGVPMTVLCLPSDELMVDDTPKSASLQRPVLSASMLPPARTHKQTCQQQSSRGSSRKLYVHCARSGEVVT